MAEAERRFQTFRKVGIARLSLLTIAVGLFTFYLLGSLPFWPSLVPLVGFFLLAPTQQRISDERRHFERAAEFYGSGLERLDDHWIGKGSTGLKYLPPSHPYAEDLDLFGAGSFFELISRARTSVGEATLADWLLSPASKDITISRQTAVDELRSSLDLREDIALLGENIHTGADAAALSEWAAAPPWKITGSVRAIGFLLSGLALITLIAWIAGFDAKIFLVAVILSQLFGFHFRGPVQKVISSVDVPAKDLQLLVEVLRRIEQEQFTSPRLVELRSQLDVAGLPPSRQIAKLKRLTELLDSRRNLFFAPIAFIVLWSLHCAIAIELWRQKSGPAVARWLAAVGEIEALSSIAGYAFEHPNDPFPEFVDEGAVFDATALGHPLISNSQNVRTDLRLSDNSSVLIVSGSNMSGKSTLLRSVGTNAVLALAGAPVRATRLLISPVQVGASIRVQDSLQAGASRFYAEITRLRQIVELTKGTIPVLFLLDEILHGTNSHDRRIGAEGVVRGLIARGAIGLVTTHDLALTKIVDDLESKAANVHFEDHLEAGRMTFDYVLRPGVLLKSNALELMRSVGLEI